MRLAGFRRKEAGHGPAVVGAVVLSMLLAVGVITLPWSLRWYNVQELDIAVRHPPSFRPIVPVECFGVASDSGSSASRTAHFATSWFGHDDLGRSVFYRLAGGLLLSALVGVSAAGMAVAVGVAWGATAGLAGGRADLIMMRIVDVLYGLPYILMIILLKIGLTRPLTAMFGGHTRVADLIVLLAAIGGISWLTMARVIRGQVLSLKTRPFVDAARAAGAGPLRIVCRHLLPNLMGPMIVYATLAVPQAILQESFLSFLGIGVQAPTPSLGRLAADGVYAINTFVGYWWLIVFPCSILVAALLALNLVGDALRDRFDPRVEP